MRDKRIQLRATITPYFVRISLQKLLCGIFSIKCNLVRPAFLIVTFAICEAVLNENTQVNSTVQPSASVSKIISSCRSPPRHIGKEFAAQCHAAGRRKVGGIASVTTHNQFNNLWFGCGRSCHRRPGPRGPGERVGSWPGAGWPSAACDMTAKHGLAPTNSNQLDRWARRLPQTAAAWIVLVIASILIALAQNWPQPRFGGHRPDRYGCEVRWATANATACMVAGGHTMTWRDVT